jgi:hypothetical protein
MPNGVVWPFLFGKGGCDEELQIQGAKFRILFCRWIFFAGERQHMFFNGLLR